jgi:hypothetical protein
MEYKSYENIMDGGYSSLSSEDGNNFIGYRLNAGQIGSPTSIQTADQLTEVVSRIKEGVKNVELQPIQAETFEQIPIQHFKEIRALMKLSGVKPSVHAPVIDPAGFVGGEGQAPRWEEAQRDDAERRLFSVIEKGQKLDPNGNIPIVFHSTGALPGPEYRPDKNVKPGEEGRFQEKKMIVINPDTGELKQVEERKLYTPGGIKFKDGRGNAMEEKDWEKGKIMTTRDSLRSQNLSEWDNQLTNFAMTKKEADLIFRNIFEKASSDVQLMETIKNGPRTREEEVKLDSLSPDLNRVNLFIDNSRLMFNSIFDKAYKSGDKEQKARLKKFSQEWTKEQGEMMAPLYKQAEERKIDRFRYDLKKNEIESSLLDKYFVKFQDSVQGIPEIYKPVEDFRLEKSAQTFGNVAFKAFDKFGKNAPVVAIENMQQGMAFSRAKDIKKLVNESRKQFVKKAMDEGYSESAAANQAKKLLGVTWDVGHLNMMRKFGFTEEDVVKETESVSKDKSMVKHVHMTDNFGYSDSHLPPGMGNVPIKKILETLEKTGKLGEMRAIVEAGGFVQHFKKSPHPWVMSAFGSSIYGAKMAPYWNQAQGMQGSYFGFPLAHLPEKHFSTYGSGFSSLPEELGGQMPGTQSRFSGTGNA